MNNEPSIMIHKFREGDKETKIVSVLSGYDIIIMDFSQPYEGCQLLLMEVIHHFLISSERWLALGL